MGRNDDSDATPVGSESPSTPSSASPGSAPDAPKPAATAKPVRSDLVAPAASSMRGFTALDQPFEDVHVLAKLPARPRITPVGRLALVLLEDAIATLRRYGGDDSYLPAKRELDWVRDGTAFAERYLTFDYCCEVLDLDPTVLRSGILRGIRGTAGRRKYRQG